jgi:hypothetical protein
MGLEHESWWGDLLAKKDTTPLRELAIEFGTSVGVLSAALKRTGTVRVPQGDSVAAPDTSQEPARPGSKDAMIEPHASLLGKVPDAEVADKAGVSVRTIASYRSRNQIAGYQGRTLPKKRRQRKSRIDPFQDLLGQVPDRVVAEKAGVTLNAVRNYRANRGIVSSRQRTSVRDEAPIERTSRPAAPAPAAAPPARPAAPPARASTPEPVAATPVAHVMAAVPQVQAIVGSFAWTVRFDGDQVAIVAGRDVVDAAQRASVAGMGAVRAIERLGALIQ